MRCRLKKVKEKQTFVPVPGDNYFVDALLPPIPALSSQVEALQLEQQSQRDTVTLLKTARTEIGGGALKHEVSACTDNKDWVSNFRSMMCQDYYQ